ncbi:eukaryotic translation initiation factor 4B isoform X2 [Parasteatoda tepidariorum]|uniref:eukaryotic translation initiation factor 4B isoform X2 n=1 Tax=Parasteatoda tepidariorum TaxID=114398 RepID=UPI00077FB7F1|nr:eukaryotic translation initiation factor 4B isoform X2 [Parasteatoda tepidariorum]
MAANAKSKKKSKGKTVDLNVFLSAGEEPPAGFALVQPKSNINWGDVMENEDLDDRFTLDYKKEEKLVLPTAPKAARGPDFDLSKVPTSPPFTAFLGNLPYDVQEDDIVTFFRQLQVQNVRLPRDTGERGRIRGFGYAEFSSRQDLIQALALNNETMKNRAIKVSLAGDHDGDRGGDRRDAGPDRTLGDWRSDRKDQAFSRDDRNDRDSFQSGRGGFGDRDRDSFRSRNNFDRDSGFSRDRFDRNERNGDRFESRNDYGNRNDREFGNKDDRFERRGNERGYGFSSDRGSNRGGGRYERGGGREYNRDSYSSRRDDSFRDNRYRDSAEREYQPRESFERRPPSDRPSYDSGGNSQKERPKLQLAPRTKPIETVPPPAEAVASSSIFGGAKPVDTAAREREIEERLAKEKESGVKEGTKESVEEGRVRKYSSSSGLSNRSRRSSESGPPGSLHHDDVSAPPYKPPIPRQERDNQTYNTLPKTRQRCSSNSSSTGSDKDNQINSKGGNTQTNRKENYSSSYHTRNDGDDSHENNEENYTEPAKGGHRSARPNHYRDNSRERALHATTYEQPKPPVYTSANKFSHLMNDADDLEAENNSE